MSKATKKLLKTIVGDARESIRAFTEEQAMSKATKKLLKTMLWDVWAVDLQVNAGYLVMSGIDFAARKIAEQNWEDDTAILVFIPSGTMLAQKPLDHHDADEAIEVFNDGFVLLN